MRLVELNVSQLFLVAASDSDSSPPVSPQTSPVKMVATSSKPRQGSAKRPYEVDADDADDADDDDDEDDDPDMLSIMALLAQKGYSGLVPKDLGKLNPPDEYETELVAMAQVRGYFQVAYKVSCYNFSARDEL